MKIIINADDFGLSKEVNNAIFNALKTGSITSSTILANSDYLGEIKSITNDFPLCSFGVHLNITEGLSLTKSEIFKKYGITDNHGYFDGSRCRHLEYEIIPEELKDSIYNEWDAQIFCLQNKGFNLSHIDGHHHCHTWNGLNDIIVNLLDRYKLNRVRNKIQPKPDFKNQFMKIIGKTTFNMGINVTKYRNSKVSDKLKGIDFYHSLLQYNKAIARFRTTDCICSYNQYSSLKMKKDTIELMCHPGHPNMIEETELLMKDIYKFKDSGVLISWNDI